MAAEAVGGNVKDRDAFNKALHAISMKDAPHGVVELDAYGQATQNIYVRRVEKVNGRWQNTVIFTYENMSQFGKYDPETYLKTDTYGPENPACTNCE